MNKELRKEIAGYFLSDSNDYLRRYLFLIEHDFTHIGSRSKLLIDLLFSFECSLKALIFIESQTDEKQTYQKTRKCSHNIAKLLAEVNTAGICDIVNFVNENELDAISVECRYALEANCSYRENGVLADKYYSTIACPNWINSIYEKAVELNNYVSSKTDPIEIISLSDIDIGLLLDNVSRLKNIKKQS